MLSKTCLAVVLPTAGLLFCAGWGLSSASPAPQTGKKPPNKPASIAKPNAVLIAQGKKVYDAQNCAGCHSIGGKGGSSGPDLTQTGSVPSHTLQWFAVHVANPKAHNPSSTMPAFAQTIKGKDMTALAAYLASLKGASSGGATDRPKTGPPPAAAVEKIEKLGGRIAPIAQNDDRLEVSLRMAGASATDKDLAVLSSLKNVSRLDLGQTAVTDAGLTAIKGLKELTVLHLEGTRITDTGLANVKDLRNLTYLNLYNTAVSDAGLEHLKGLTNLKSLYLWQTKVTDAGVSKLKQALPKVEIVMGWDQAPKK